MRNKTIIYNVLTVATATALFFTSCVKDELFDTPHPDKGAVVVSADFSERSASCTAPAEYLLHHTCCEAAEPCTMPGGSEKCLPELFSPGSHTFHAWNACGKMTVTDGTIKVNETAPGTIESMPGYLFTARVEKEIIKDDTTRVEIKMLQRTRDLRLELTVTEGDPERIASVRGTLTGVAGAFDLAGQTVTGNAANATVAFTRDGDKLTAEARLLGFIGTAPTLTLEITFTDGRTQTVLHDSFAEAVKDFGKDMTETLVLTNRLNTPVEAGMTATIEEWKPGNGGGEDVEVN